jgi:CBS domain-containing protein
MRTIDAIHRSGVGIEPQRTVRDAATIMEQAGIGSLAVVDGSRLVGILTDRDLVRRVLAAGVPDDVRVDSVMTTPVVTISADATLEEAYSTFGTHGLRRLPIVRDNNFVGMLVLDDLLVGLVGQLTDLTRPITGEILFAHRDTRVPAPI